jgi:hypothetical protein
MRISSVLRKGARAAAAMPVIARCWFRVKGSFSGKPILLPLPVVVKGTTFGLSSAGKGQV